MNNRKLLKERLRPIVKSIINEITDTVYWIKYHPNDGIPKKVYETYVFDEQDLQKRFDNFLENIKVGEMLEYGKSDKKNFYPAMMTVEKTKKGYIAYNQHGRRQTYKPKYQGNFNAKI